MFVEKSLRYISICKYFVRNLIIRTDQSRKLLHILPREDDDGAKQGGDQEQEEDEKKKVHMVGGRERKG